TELVPVPRGVALRVDRDVRARLRRSADRDRDGTVRRNPGCRRVQPRRGRGRPARGALRHVHGGADRDLPTERREDRGCGRGGRRCAMTRGGRHRRLMGEMNVVPYIDVMLVLLIIFMITAPLLTQGIAVDLPDAGAEPLDPELMQDNEP